MRLVSDMTDTIRPGAAVVAADGDRIGEVREVREGHIVVDRGLLGGDDLYVPVDALTDTDRDPVRLNLPADEVDSQGWHVRPSSSFEHATPAYPEVPETTTIQTAGYSAGVLSAPEAQGFVRDIDADDDEVLANRTIDPDAAAALDDED